MYKLVLLLIVDKLGVIMHVNFNSLDIGLGGGNRFIFELANSLIDKNNQVTITYLGDETSYSWFPEVKAEMISVKDCYLDSPLTKAIRKVFALTSKRQYSNLSDREKRLMDNIPKCDVNVATFCFTAFPTYYSKKGDGFYLVQHYEPWFFDDDKTCSRAELTYNLPLKKLCVSRWLADKVHGTYIGNGINLSKFNKQKTQKIYDVMMVVRQGIGWKGNYNQVLNVLSKKGLKVFVADGQLSDYEIVSSYNSSRMLLFLSEHEGFGYPPLEAMACGIPVITTPCLEYVNHMENAYVLKQDYSVNDILKAIDYITDNDSAYSMLVENGRKTAERLNFENVVNRFIEMIHCP
jgi:hypothetical protein